MSWTLSSLIKWLNLSYICSDSLSLNRLDNIDRYVWSYGESEGLSTLGFGLSTLGQEWEDTTLSL